MKNFAFLLAVTAAFCIAEESKGTWQKFVDFFSPSKSVTGNSELEQKIQKLEKKIQTTKNDYNREHRPQRKTMLKRELEDLTHERDSLLTVYETQKNASSAVSSSSAFLSSSTNLSSSIASTQPSSSIVSSSSTAQQVQKPVLPVVQPMPAAQPTEQCDTVWIIQKKVVHDTVFVHDTIYVKE